MEPDARAQVRLIIESADDLGGRAISERLTALFAHHSARRVLQSGKTIKVGVRILEEEAGRFIASLVDQVAVVAKDIEAFAMIREAVDRFLPRAQDNMEKIVGMATGKQPEAFGSVGNAAIDLWNQAKARLDRQVEVHWFAFTVPSTRLSAVGFPKLTTPTVEAPRNKGGKPLAAHWDEMWSAIAVQLWNGDLKPTKQADIKRAMVDWFTDQGIDVGDTAVTDRARQLWRKIEGAD